MLSTNEILGRARHYEQVARRSAAMSVSFASMEPEANLHAIAAALNARGHCEAEVAEGATRYQVLCVRRH